MCLDYIADSLNEDQLKVLVRATNRGKKDKTWECFMVRRAYCKRH